MNMQRVSSPARSSTSTCSWRGTEVEGLELLRGDRVPSTRRLVLLDIDLPRMNGIEMLKEMRKDEELRTTPVVVLTTSDQERDLTAAYGLNVAGYLVKPMAFPEVRRAGDHAESILDPRGDALSPEQRSARMLLVEDDEVDRLAVRRALAKTDFHPQLTEARDCAEARAALRAGAFDCVLLDVYLPDGDGVTLLREERAAGNDTPIIVLTGQGDEVLAVELMKAGASDYVPKNLLTPEALTQSLRRAIRLRDAEHRATAARQQLERQAAQLQRLAQMGATVHAAPTVDDALELIARLARELVGAKQGAVIFEPRAGAPALTSLSSSSTPPPRARRWPWVEAWRSGTR